jgi:phage baseplate assembly protein gpV
MSSASSTTSSTDTTAASITFSATMIDDYLYTMVPPVAQSVNNMFVVVQNLSSDQPEAELVTLNSSGQVIHIGPNSESNSGWTETTVPVQTAPPGTVQKLLSFYEENVLHVFIFYSTDSVNSALVWMQQSDDGTWTQITLGGDLGNALGNTSQADVFEDAGGNHYIYGISNNYLTPTFFVTSRPSGLTDWQVTFLSPSQSSAYRLLPGTGDNQLVALWISGPSIIFRGLQWANGMFQWNPNPAQSFNLQQGTLTGSDILPLPDITGESVNENDFLLLGNNQQLYYVTGYDQPFPSFTILSGQTAQPQGVSAVAMGVDSQQLVMIFALDTTNQALWLLRQTGVDNNGNLTFGGWVALGNVFTNIACPTRMTLGPELYAVDAMRSIQHLIQNVAPVSSTLSSDSTQTIDGTWFLERIEGPLPSTVPPQQYPTYTNEITALDDNNAALPGVLINVTADRSAVIIADGISYHIDPNTSAQLVTNSYGKATVVFAANNLTAPVLNVNVPSFMQPGETLPFRSDLQLHNRLAGNDPQFPINGTTLKESGLISTEDMGLANDLATAVQSVGQTLVAMSTSQNSPELRKKNLAALEIQSWELDFAVTGQPSARPSRTSGAMSATSSRTWSKI